jgi:hypothetical protein
MSKLYVAPSSGEPGDPNKPPNPGCDRIDHANTPNREGGMRNDPVYHPAPRGLPPLPRRMA